MKLFFISNVIVHIKDDITLLNPQKDYDYFFEQTPDHSLFLTSEHPRILIKSNPADVIPILQFLTFNRKQLTQEKHITLWVDNHSATKELMQKNLRIISSAGGIVRKNNQTLMIYRLGKWDLPKGKIEPGETTPEAAIREVKEECNVKARIDDEICTTWYTFSKSRKMIVKKVTWYSMSCIDDSFKRPQRKEGIQKVAWIKLDGLPKALDNTYASVRSIYRHYFDQGLHQQYAAKALNSLRS